MKVIYAGLPKTGTKTMNAALTELGYNCYDYMENYRFLGDQWMKIFKEGGTTEDFRKMFEDVDAVMDVPCCFFWEEIHKAFPDAKIIFSTRENEDVWFKSLTNQINSNEQPIMKILQLLTPSFHHFGRYGLLNCLVTFGVDLKPSLFSNDIGNELLFKKRYRAHNSYVLKTAPKDKLLVIDFADGWEPLCEFLGHPVPNVPFPHKNKKGDIIQELMEKDPFMKRLQFEMKISSSLIVCLFGFGIYKLVTRPLNSTNLLNYITSPLNNLLQKLGY